MSLMDALFYWLQMKLVSDSRPGDAAARETAAFFAQILSDSHGLTSFEVVRMEEEKIHVAYRTGEGAERTVWFDREAAEQMIRHPVVSRDEKNQAEKEQEP